MELNDIFDYLIEPYKNYEHLHIVLELLAAFFGIFSVFLSIRKNIWVYPIGIISTSIYVYLNFQWTLIGEMLINIYYTVMSLYGWWLWYWDAEVFTSSIKLTSSNLTVRTISLFFIGYIAVITIYYFNFGSFLAIPAINYIDTLASAIFLVAMYLMAHKRVEHWLFWILGNGLAIYQFVVKGYAITAFQFVVFLILAVMGWKTWRKK
ncbi:MAG: nicotinamide mononucleotide transporter [Chitinophagales bacterium]|nr:nicotinamide mononucleotide transporter [Chitinophagales bacterium]